MTPIGNRILIEPAPVKEKTESGLFIPESAQRVERAEGTVRAIGPKVTDVKPGDRVLFNRLAGTSVNDFRLVAIDDVIAILT